MKQRKYVLFAVLALLCSVTIVFFGTTVSGSDELLGTGERVTVLCMGLDDAAENTDVMLLLTLDPIAKTVSLLQLPRDTYFRAGTPQNKINQLYPTQRSQGSGAADALAFVKSEIAAVLGITIDYYAALDLSSVAALVDAMGGLDVTVPSDIRLPRHNGEGYIEIPAGAQRLTGEQAVAFLRYRTEYQEGDLGRIDAQKLLLAAVYRRAKGEMSLGELAELLAEGYRSMRTDMPLTRQITLAYAFYRDRSAYGIRLATLPGSAVRGENGSGPWYYVPSRKASQELLAALGYHAELDRDLRLTDKNSPELYSLYEKNDVSYVIYTEETLKDMDIKINTK